MAYLHFQPPQEPGKAKRSSNKPISHGRTLSAWSFLQKFGKRTTIHGMKRILNEDATPYERCIWLFIFLFALWSCIYIGLILSKRYNDSTLETVIDSTRLPVFRTYFPVVTICNRNRLNWQRLEEAKELFMPGEESQLKLDLFEKIVGAYDDIRFGNFGEFSTLQFEPLELINHVNFTMVADFMAWRCEEFLTDCFWRNFPMNCCDMFFKRRNKNGFCWAFNTLESEGGRRMQLLDPKWPWRTGNAGPKTGLNVRVLIQPEKHNPNSSQRKGVEVMITEPTVWHDDLFFIPEYSNTLLVVEPIIFFYDNGTRRVSSEKRQCVFEDERDSLDYKTLHGYNYMNENCLSECQQQYLLKYCNCTLDILFPPNPYRSCEAKDLPCLARYNGYFQYNDLLGEEDYVTNDVPGMVCQCYRNCHSLNYITDVRPSLVPTEVNENSSYVDLDVHFRFETLMVYRTSLVFGWVDLLVAFGGIAGLFLGCSLISGMEIVYLIAIETPAFFVKKIKKWQHHLTASKNTNYGNSSRESGLYKHNKGYYGNKERQIRIAFAESEKYMRWK